MSRPQKQEPRQFTANITFQVATQQERTYDTDDAWYVVGADRGRNQIHNGDVRIKTSTLS